MTGPGSSGLAASRARIYRVLALAYARPPDAQLLELLRAWVKDGLSQTALPEGMEHGLRKLEVWLEKAGVPPQTEAVNALQAEFTQLIRGLSRSHSPPPPYESVYTDNGLVHGPSTERVAQEYRRFNLKGRNNEPPDHISLELDFMRFLCEKEARAWQREEGGQELLEEEDAFLGEHLAVWVPAFCANLTKFDTTGFYNGLADLTRGWILCDQRIVRGIIGYASVPDDP